MAVTAAAGEAAEDCSASAFPRSPPARVSPPLAPARSRNPHPPPSRPPQLCACGHRTAAGSGAAVGSEGTEEAAAMAAMEAAAARAAAAAMEAAAATEAADCSASAPPWSLAHRRHPPPPPSRPRCWCGCGRREEGGWAAAGGLAAAGVGSAGAEGSEAAAARAEAAGQARRRNHQTPLSRPRRAIVVQAGSLGRDGGGAMAGAVRQRRHPPHPRPGPHSTPFRVTSTQNSNPQASSPVPRVSTDNRTGLGV